MPMKVIENTGDSAMFVGGKMILPGATDMVDVPDDAQSDQVEEGGPEIVNEQAGVALAELLELKVGDIVPELPGLSDDQLAQLADLEAAGKNRKGVLAEVTVERLKRASTGADSAGGGGENPEASADAKLKDDDGDEPDESTGEGGAV